MVQHFKICWHKKIQALFCQGTYYCLTTNQWTKSLGDGEEEGPICHIVLDLGGGSSFGRIWEDKGFVFFHCSA